MTDLEVIVFISKTVRNDKFKVCSAQFVGGSHTNTLISVSGTPPFVAGAGAGAVFLVWLIGGESWKRELPAAIQINATFYPI